MRSLSLPAQFKLFRSLLQEPYHEPMHSKSLQPLVCNRRLHSVQRRFLDFDLCTVHSILGGIRPNLRTKEEDKKSKRRNDSHNDSTDIESSIISLLGDKIGHTKRNSKGDDTTNSAN